MNALMLIHDAVITIWERNFQLGFYSILMYVSIIVYESLNQNDDAALIHRKSWSNWSILTVIVALLAAIGGLLVAATLKYSDSISKTLAAAGAIVVSTLLGHYFLHGPLGYEVCIGGVIVVLSIVTYTFDNSITLIKVSSNLQNIADKL